MKTTKNNEEITRKKAVIEYINLLKSLGVETQDWMLEYLEYAK